MCDCKEMFRVCGKLHVWSAIKIWVDLLKWFKLWDALPPKLSVPPSSEIVGEWKHILGYKNGLDLFYSRAKSVGARTLESVSEGNIV